MATWRWKSDESTAERTRLDLAIFEALKSSKGSWTETAETEIQPSRSGVKKMIQSGNVKLNEKQCKPSDSISVGDIVEIEFHRPTLSIAKVDPKLKIPILYEDSDIIVINKPRGIPVHPAPSHNDATVVDFLLSKGKSLCSAAGDERPGVVHRIDKNTTGVIVLAKSDLAYLKLCEAFSQHNLVRSYWALTYQSLISSNASQPWLRYESMIGRNPRDRKKMAIVKSHGKPAITWFRTLRSFRKKGSSQVFSSLTEARLETGRTHQVRVHLTALGASILGDDKYGLPSEKQEKWKIIPSEIQSHINRQNGQALHARKLEFKHPRTGELLSFIAEPFENFQSLLTALGRYEFDDRLNDE